MSRSSASKAAANALLAPFRKVPRQEAAAKIATTEFPAFFPFPTASFKRMNEKDDFTFYKEPRLVHHIDDAARRSLTGWYAKNLPKDPAVHVDLCSSWVSHLPAEYCPKHVIGVGMSEAELDANERLNERRLRDLNVNPTLEGLGFEKEGVDVFTMNCSIDYLTQPDLVFAEMKEYLKDDGLAVISFSDRMFHAKVIGMWLNANDAQRMVMISSYFHSAGFTQIQAEDATYHPPDGCPKDPMLIVHARKAKE